MGREFKFRVWDTTSKKMHSLTEIENYPMAWLAKGDTDYTKFMQYTGLKANGKEIYEGDILRRLTDGRLRKVIFEYGAFAGENISIEPHNTFNSFPFSNYDNNMWEVIGNIYENPELLEGSK